VVVEAEPSGEPEIRAAGGVLWRASDRGPEVAVVHRQRYDDWSLPKGKLNPGESEIDGALREVREETGLSAEPGSFLGRERYRDRKDRLKEVAYWAMRPTGGSFEPNSEVDRLEWLPVADAAERLSYSRDRAILQRLRVDRRQPSAGASAERHRPSNYAQQAATYDRTRSASPAVVRTMSTFLDPAEGRRLVDIAAGTGNYSKAMQSRGFDVIATDVEPAMLERSVQKIGAGRQVVADATELPFRDATFDCATLVLGLHHIRPPQAALAEARRVVRGGPLVVVGFAAEQVENLFVWDYFPGSRDIVPPENPPAEVFEQWAREAGFSPVEAKTFFYLDTADASLAALHTDPLKLAGPAYLRNTSFFRRLPPDAQKAGLAGLAQALRSGELGRRVKKSVARAAEIGHGTVYACWP
jgi:ubiquinone/menaquinone biosynthesis C-methylase UbiE/8-oxo-dGTP pyrophosphatase MutT (NUDIX family)